MVYFLMYLENYVKSYKNVKIRLKSLKTVILGNFSAVSPNFYR